MNFVRGSRSDLDDWDIPTRYLRHDNWGAGDIRRFVAIGTPFNGTPLATYGQELWDPALGARVTDILRDFFPDAYEKLFPNGHFDFPGAVIDLAEGSAAQLLLEGMDPSAIAYRDPETGLWIQGDGEAAIYPSDRRAVRWVFVAGTEASLDEIGGVAFALEVMLRAGLAELIGLLFGFDHVAALARLNSVESDGAVTVLSQQNRVDEFDGNGRGPPPFALHPHAVDASGSDLGENNSLVITQEIRRLLGRPASEFAKTGLDK